MYINKYLPAGDDYPVEMQTESWVYSTKKLWWSRLVGYVLGRFRGVLETLDLHDAMRVVKFGLLLSVQNFFCILERYNAETHTFFTHVGEMGMEMHEMLEVTRLSEKDYPYEEFILTIRS